MQKFQYNKKGLLTKKTKYEYNELTQTIIYKYNSDDLVESIVAKDQSGNETITVTNTYTGKQLTKSVTVSSILGSRTVEKFYYTKNGVLSKKTIKTKGGWYEGESSTKYTFDKKGRLTKQVVTQAGTSTTRTFKNDGNGYVSKYTFDGGYTSRKLTYTDGVLTKYKDTSVYNGSKSSGNAYHITSKAVSVSKSRSAIVEAQQREIINYPYNLELYLIYQ